MDQAAERMRAAAQAAGQGHMFDGWESLSEDQQEELLQDTKDIDFTYLESIYKASMTAGTAGAADVQPCTDVLSLNDGSLEERAVWRQHGLQLIAQGRIAVLLLAGGQGTRLGSALPKGCYDVGLPSKKSLFQLQAERLRKVQQLAAAAVASTASSMATGGSTGPAAGGTSTPSGGTTSTGGTVASNGTGAASAAAPQLLHWYIMTSPFTHADTLSHFEEHSYFGLERDQVHFFQQGFLPCLTEQGKVILETSCRVAKAPDGNGGVYLALQRSGCLADMAARGVEGVDVYCVDNVLARLADPLFVGYCHSRGTEVGAKVVAKAYPEEKVGVFATRNGALTVLEYSELDPGIAAAPNPKTGRLLYNWSNICMHYFAVEWLNRVTTKLQKGSAYHVAKKKIPSKDGPVPGIKLELFIFDTFPMASPDRTALMEVQREAEFAPVKNAPGSATDSPDTARAAVMQLHRSWVQAAGGQVLSPEGVEVTPAISYAGEGLEPRCRGKRFDAAWSDDLQGLSKQQ